MNNTLLMTLYLVEVIGISFYLYTFPFFENAKLKPLSKIWWKWNNVYLATIVLPFLLISLIIPSHQVTVLLFSILTPAVFLLLIVGLRKYLKVLKCLVNGNWMSLCFTTLYFLFYLLLENPSVYLKYGLCVSIFAFLVSAFITDNLMKKIKHTEIIKIEFIN